MPEMEPLLRVVPAKSSGVRLDVFLAGQPEVQNRSQARRMIDLGLVEVPGHRVRPGLNLEVGLEVTFTIDAPVIIDALSPDMPVPEIPLLYDDPDICAINKPVGIAAHPRDRRHESTFQLFLTQTRQICILFNAFGMPLSLDRSNVHIV